MGDEVRHELEQVIGRSTDVKERAPEVHERADQARHRHDRRMRPDPQRAVRARRHEIETLEPAIATHEQAAESSNGRDGSDRAAEARARADHDRQLLAQARAELAKDEATAGETR